ncbi:MAG TPA: SIR2 family protein [Puia sp.]|nr:SIR2 family protein [Puia sp.]
MNKKKAVFLFGAGAALDWGGPKTICNGDHLTFLPEHASPDVIKNRICCLTHLMRETGFKSKNGNRISENIYQKLIKGRLEIDHANFESIFNFIDELFAYYGDTTKNDFFSFLDFPEDLKDELFNYIRTENPVDNSFNLSVPEYEFYKDRLQEGTIPEQQFAGWLLDDLIKGIHGHISKYSYHTPSHNVIFNEANENNNRLFCSWMNSLKDEHSIRMYTLNYDRLFKLLLEKDGMEIFEGFIPYNPSIGYFGRYKADIPRIQNDTESNVYYNLHGCVTWDLEAENVNQLPGYEYYLTIAPVTRTSSAVIEIEKGKKLLLANIITGYQKVQRTALAPFRQMLSAFDRDCVSADEIFIIGYSYADEHINDIIRNARKYNPAVKITLINPIFDDEKFMFDFILHWEELKGRIYDKDGNDIISEQFNVRAKQMKFSEYLENNYKIT